MDKLNPDDLLDAVATAHRASVFSVGSLWWISENIWRNAQRVNSDEWRTDKRSHPGTFLPSPHSFEVPQGRIPIHAGRSPRQGYEAETDIIVTLNPTANPGKKTKFAGKRGFIGQIRRDRLLEIQWDLHKPADQNWLHPNSELKTLNDTDRAKLIAWSQSILSFP
jgi:hypothetical protein